MLFTVRLKDNKEFVRLYGKGAFVSCGMCTVYYRRNGRKENRKCCHEEPCQKSYQAGLQGK